MPDSSSKYVPQIDGLRAIAVLAVIAYHLNPAFLPGGFTGVDVFFVISGFVVSGSVARLEGKGLGSFFAYFYARRLFRIGPALIICLFVTTLFFVIWIPTALQSQAIERAGLAAFFGLSNFSLARTEHDYFAPAAGLNPFTHTWSLSVEEQFYLVFPWLFVMWLRRRRGEATVLTAISFMLSLAWSCLASRDASGTGFYLITTRFWELAAGVLLFQATARLAGPGGATGTGGPTYRRVCGYGVFGSAGLLVAGLLSSAPQTTPFPGGILPSLGALGLLGFLPGVSERHAVLRLLRAKILRYTGRISYSLYLWHWPVFVFFRWTLGLQSAPCGAAALIITLALAASSYHFVEAPLRHWPDRRGFSRNRAIGMGVLALTSGYVACTGLWALQPAISLSTVTRHSIDWYPYGANTDAAFPGCQVVSDRLPVPGAKGDWYWAFHRAGCANAVLFPHRIFAIGDSHSAAYQAMLKDITLRTGAPTYLYWQGGCAFIAAPQPPAPRCAVYDRAALPDMMAKVQPDDIVFLASLRMPPSGPQAAAYRAASALTALPVLRGISATGARIVLEAPTPEFPSPAFRCADWFDRNNPVCRPRTIDRQGFERQRAPVLALFTQFQSEIPNIHVWDPAATLCNAATCFQFAAGRPLFFDGDHLSGYAGIKLRPDFLRFIETIVSSGNVIP